MSAPLLVNIALSPFVICRSFLFSLKTLFFFFADIIQFHGFKLPASNSQFETTYLTLSPEFQIFISNCILDTSMVNLRYSKRTCPYSWLQNLFSPESLSASPQPPHPPAHSWRLPSIIFPSKPSENWVGTTFKVSTEPRYFSSCPGYFS